MVRRFIAVLVLLSIYWVALADVVVPGHIHKQFMFTNLDKFPGFNFTYLHHSYHYDRGYQPNPADTVVVENNQRYFVSQKGSGDEALMAGDGKGNFFVSDLKLGGVTDVSPSISGLVEVYTIISIKNREIKIKKIKEITLYPDGHEKVRKSDSGFFGWIGIDGFTSGLAIASMAGLLGILVLFMLRKRKPRYIQMAT